VEGDTRFYGLNYAHKGTTGLRTKGGEKASGVKQKKFPLGTKNHPHMYGEGTEGKNQKLVEVPR